MNKKVPLRRCIACREHKEKRELIRVVNHPEHGVMVDTTGKANGRGAYLCRSEACVNVAKKKNLLKNALKTSVSDSVYEEILRHVN